MFIQMIRGPVSDPDTLRRLNDRWLAELKPGAIGFLGSTGGITADGQFFLAARFASEDDARANSDRPEQGNWWAEAEKCFAEPPTFAETSDVETILGGGSDDAGFVQVIAARVLDPEGVSPDGEEEFIKEHRPDILGATTCWLDDRARFVQVIYFTDEATARAAESRERTPEEDAFMSGWESAVADMEFLDLTDPLLT